MASIVIAGDTSGAVTIAAPATAGTPTLTLPTTSGTLVVTGGAQTVQFAAGSAAAPSITFTGDTNTGIFSPAADTIGFSEGGVESMRIDSSGNLLVGKTITGDTTEGNIIAPTYVFFTRNGFAPLNLRRLTSSGSIAEFYSGTSGTSAGAISVASTGMTYTGTNGITFTATQSASSNVNTLDDYEEGTWTPTVTTATGTPAYDYQQGWYTKVGELVTVGAIIGINNSNVLTGNITVSSLPFTIKGTGTGYVFGVAGSSSDGTGFTWPIKGQYTVGIIGQPSTNVVKVRDTGAPAAIDFINYNDAGVNASWYFRFVISYPVA